MPLARKEAPFNFAACHTSRIAILFSVAPGLFSGKAVTGKSKQMEAIKAQFKARRLWYFCVGIYTMIAKFNGYN